MDNRKFYTSASGQAENRKRKSDHLDAIESVVKKTNTNVIAVPKAVEASGSGSTGGGNKKCRANNRLKALRTKLNQSATEESRVVNVLSLSCNKALSDTSVSYDNSSPDPKKRRRIAKAARKAKKALDNKVDKAQNASVQQSSNSKLVVNPISYSFNKTLSERKQLIGKTSTPLKVEQNKLPSASVVFKSPQTVSSSQKKLPSPSTVVKSQTVSSNQKKLPSPSTVVKSKTVSSNRNKLPSPSTVVKSETVNLPSPKTVFSPSPQTGFSPSPLTVFSQSPRTENFSNEVFVFQSTPNNSLGNVAVGESKSLGDQFGEDMEWEEVDEPYIPNVSTDTEQSCSKSTIEGNVSAVNIPSKVYAVLDTNIFLHHFDIFKRLLEYPRKDLVVYIPYQVFQELDYMKDGRAQRENKTTAAIAINYINKKLTPDKRLQGESAEDALARKLKNTSGDDSILACCFELRKKDADVILVTQDNNLRNKAIVSHLKTTTQDGIFNLLNALPTEDHDEHPLITEIREELGCLCTFIIVKRFEHQYGDNWKKKIPPERPLAFKKCLEILTQYWNAICEPADELDFNNLGLDKTWKLRIEELITFLKIHDKIRMCDFSEFKDHCLMVLVYLQHGFRTYYDNIEVLYRKIIDKSRKLSSS